MASSGSSHVHRVMMPGGRVARAFGLVLAAALMAMAIWSGPLVASTGEGWLVPEPDAGSASGLSVNADRTELRLSGEIGEGVAERLAQLLRDNPGIRTIHLTSEGGYVDEAEAIGDLVAARRLVTHVPDYCISACTLIFVRGPERLISAGARLGFHAPFESGSGGGPDVQVDGDPERLAYLAAGVAPDFAETALRVPSSDIWIPDTERLIAANVVTAVIGAGPRAP